MALRVRLPRLPRGRPRLRPRQPARGQAGRAPRLHRPGARRRERRQRRRRHRDLRLGRSEVRLRPALDDGADHDQPHRRAGDGGADGRRHGQGPRRADPRAVRAALVALLDLRRPAREPRHLHLGVRRGRRGARARGGAAPGVGADRGGRRLAPRRARLVQARRAGLRRDDDPVLRLSDRGDPRAPALALGRPGGRRAADPPHERVHHPVHRDCRDDDHAVHAALSPVGRRRARDGAGGHPGRARRGGGGLDLREPRGRLHHHRHRGDALRPRRPHRDERGARPPRRSSRSRAASPRRCSPSGCSGPACSPQRSSRSPPPT